jgi:hypothetical protein
MTETTKRGPGRPKKGEVVAKKEGNRGVRGRPPGDAAIINEYKARMLASPKSGKVMDAIFNAALDDEHKNQAAAWKLLMDRMLPVSYFEKDKMSQGKNSVSITITGVGSKTTVQNDDDIIDVEPIETDDQ